MLDAVGDLALLGHPLIGHVVAHRAGHQLHTDLGRALLADPEAFALVEADAVASVALHPAVAPAYTPIS
jgi:UDP-3-O-[3-hydroxymyristoyl] N-acetylglucosamine deacetylase